MRAFIAAGIGGQMVMAISELDLLVAFYDGSYFDSILYRVRDALIPESVLKSVH